MLTLGAEPSYKTDVEAERLLLPALSAAAPDATLIPTAPSEFGVIVAEYDEPAPLKFAKVPFETFTSEAVNPVTTSLKLKLTVNEVD